LTCHRSCQADQENCEPFVHRVHEVLSSWPDRRYHDGPVGVTSQSAIIARWRSVGRGALPRCAPPDSGADRLLNDLADGLQIAQESPRPFAILAARNSSISTLPE